jgi:uncharacterized protein
VVELLTSFSVPALALFAAYAAVATVAQKLTGFAFTLLLLGLGGVMDLAPVADLANAATVLSLASAWSALSRGRRGIDFGIWRSTVWGGLIGVVAGLLLLGWLQANLLALLKLILGITVMACAVSLLVRTKSRPKASSPVSFVGYGLLSGVLGGLFAASGPPLVYHLYRQPLPVEIMRNTLVTALSVISLVRLVLVVSTGGFSTQSAVLCLVAAPIVLGISFLMNRGFAAIPRAVVLRAVSAILVVTGIALCAQAVRQMA